MARANLRRAGDVVRVAADWKASIFETEGLKAGYWCSADDFGRHHHGKEFIVVKTAMAGGGTGHGPGDIYPDGHQLTLLPYEAGRINLAGPVVHIFQTGSFSNVIPNPEYLASRLDLVRSFNADLFLEELQKKAEANRVSAEEANDNKLIALGRAAIAMGLREDETGTFKQVLDQIFSGRPVVGWRRAGRRYPAP